MNKPVIVEVFAEGAVVEFAGAGMGAPRTGLAGIATVMGNREVHQVIREFTAAYLEGNHDPILLMMGAVSPVEAVATQAYLIEAPADVEEGEEYMLLVGEKEGVYYFSFNTTDALDSIGEDGVMDGAFVGISCPVEHIEAFVADIKAIDYTNAVSQEA